MEALAESLVDAILDIDGCCLLAVTGAGVSRASGIPTFRGADPDAVWKTSDIALATHDYFVRDPVRQWLWYLERFDSANRRVPNAAHEALVSLEAWLGDHGGRLQVVTQNIDTLHEAAGTCNLIKVHGSSDRVRCARRGCSKGAPSGSLAFRAADFDAFRRRPERKNLPVCPDCGELLRAHVLFFDEFYLEHSDYRFPEAQAAGEAADLILFIGTSFSVGITELYLQAGARRRIPMFSIDPVTSKSTPAVLRPLPAPAESLLPAVVELIGRRAESHS